MLNLKGCGTALVTPFRDGEVDYEAYASHIDRQVKGNVDFLVPLATTGETPTLSEKEKLKLLEITRAHAKGLPLLVGCGSNSIPATLSNMKLLGPSGVDAWLVVVPFYNKPTQEGQYQYFKAIAESTDIPVVIYNVPGRTGANMTAATCLRLAREVKNIIGIKEASGKIDQVEEILKGLSQDKEVAARFSVLSGDDDMTFDMMKLGARGVVSVASNIAPSEVSQMTSLMLKAQDGICPKANEKKASEINGRLQPLFRNCFVESNPIPVKAGLALQGYMTAEVRLPLTEATDKTKAIMAETLGIA